MKLSILSILTIGLCGLIATTAFAQGTAFTYQGRLNDGGNPANGTYDLRFSVYDSTNSPGVLIAGPVTNSLVTVSNGLFVVALDFGPGVFDGSARWLDIGVRSNGVASFTALNARQQLTPSPYAILAANVQANSIGSSALQNGSITAAKMAPNAVGTSAIVDGSIAAADVVTNTFWQATGNGGTSAGNQFFGTTDNQPLEAKVNNQRALRLEPNSGGAPNVIGGSINNYAGFGVIGAAIVGGGATNYQGTAYTNAALGALSTVLGGGGNTASGRFSAAGGLNTTASGFGAFSMGWGTVASADFGSTAFGYFNIASGSSAFSAGSFNTASGRNSTALGYSSQALHNGSFIWADEQSTFFSSTTTNQFSVRANGGVRLETSGAGATLDGQPVLTLTAAINANNLSGTVADARLSSNVALLNRNGQTFTGSNAFGNLSITAPGALNFGATTRQVLNLWGSQYGIGVQSYTLYFRTDDSYPGGGFAWYQGGTHADAGSGGGKTLMTLDNSGNLFVMNNVYAGNLLLTSDRNVKEKFAAADVREVLDKVTALPISSWNYKNDAASRHIGPMAQDFHSSFGTGTDDRFIAVVDEGGVALAAIQGLNQKLETELNEKNSRIVELEKRLERLEEKFRALANVKEEGVRP